MGHSAQAILFYGMGWSEEGMLDRCSRGESYLIKKGLWTPMPWNSEWDNMNYEDREDYRAYSENNRTKKFALLNDLPWEFINHCCEDVPMVALAMKRGMQRIELGEVGGVKLSFVPPDASQVLQEVLSTLGLSMPKSGIGWRIVVKYS